MHCPVTDCHKNPLGVRQRIQWEASSVKVTPPDTHSIVAAVITNQELYTLTNSDMLTTPRAAASLFACCCCHAKNLETAFILMLHNSQTHKANSKMSCIKQGCSF